MPLVTRWFPRFFGSAALAALFAMACAKEKAEPAPEAPSRVVPAASARAASAAVASSSKVEPTTPPAAADASVATATDAGAPPKDDSPPPKVKIVTIGMHVAGGPFDEETKVPFKKAVEPHFPELARCFRLVTTPKTGDVGVDLLIEPGGGKPKVTNPRSSIDGEGFKPCVVAFFESIEFDKPKNGRTGVSYSVRFKP